MGGKSRKSGGVSKKLINKIKNKKGKENESSSRNLFSESSEKEKSQSELLDE